MKYGFIDYYLDEFHANNYPEWIKNATGETPEIYAFGEIDSPKEGGLTTDEWCKKYGAVRMPSIKAVCEAADAVIVLSPDDPDNHLRYLKEVFSFAKPTFIDKTFAVSAKEAEEIIRIGEESGTPFFSSSSLRFAPEYVKWTQRAESAVVSGAGGHFDVELIHPIEICNAVMGNGAEELITNGDRDQLVAMIRYKDGRHATVNFTLRCRGLDYSAQVRNGETNALYIAKENFFQYLTNEIVAFFKKPEKIPVPHEDTLEAMKIRDAVLKGIEKPYTWIEI